MDLFDYAESVHAKEKGISVATLGREGLLEYARSVARNLAKSHSQKECHADAVQEILIKQGHDLGPAAGALFRGPEWEWTGGFVTSVRVNNHARLLRVWRLVQP